MIETKSIKKCSEEDGLDIIAAALKTAEEFGEFNAALINKLGLSNKSASSKPNTLEEAVDLLVCTLDLLYKDGETDESIQLMIEQKTEKWKKKIDNAFYRELHLSEKCL